ncbi:hypothetical protein AB9N12_09845 [Bacteroides sp. AN502(2024)]
MVSRLPEGTNKADVLHYSVDEWSNVGFRLGVSFQNEPVAIRILR